MKKLILAFAAMLLISFGLKAQDFDIPEELNEAVKFEFSAYGDKASQEVTVVVLVHALLPGVTEVNVGADKGATTFDPMGMPVKMKRTDPEGKEAVKIESDQDVKFVFSIKRMQLSDAQIQAITLPIVVRNEETGFMYDSAKEEMRHITANKLPIQWN